jgi:hypothetical protein
MRARRSESRGSGKIRRRLVMEIQGEVASGRSAAG